MKLHSGKYFSGDIITLCCCSFRVKTILSILCGNKTGLIAYGAVWVRYFFVVTSSISGWMLVWLELGELLALIGNY